MPAHHFSGHAASNQDYARSHNHNRSSKRQRNHNQTVTSPSSNILFVKNVPPWTAQRTLPQLFYSLNAQYVKNIYPASNITTVVVSFATPEDAEWARKETDGMMVDCVVLEVEGYQERKNVRWLREMRLDKKLWGVDRYDEDSNYEDENKDEEEGYWDYEEGGVTLGVTYKAPEGNTWAKVLAKPAEMQSFPSLPTKVFRTKMSAQPAKEPTAQPVTPPVSPKTLPAVPDLRRPSTVDPSDESQPKTSVFDSGSHSQRTSFSSVAEQTVAVVNAVRTECTEPRPVASSEATVVPAQTNVAENRAENRSTEASTYAKVEASGLESIDTTARIRMRHSRDCAFCQGSRRT